MKICSSCLVSQPLEHYHNSSRSKDGKQSRCKTCNRKQRVAYYRTAEGRKSNELSGKRNDIRNQQYVYEYLSKHPCADCNEADIVVLEFDHLRDKEFNVCKGIKAGYSLQRIKNEIEKCEVVCANCHKRRTAQRAGWIKLHFKVHPVGIEPT